MNKTSCKTKIKGLENELSLLKKESKNLLDRVDFLSTYDLTPEYDKVFLKKFKEHFEKGNYEILSVFMKDSIFSEDDQTLINNISKITKQISFFKCLLNDMESIYFDGDIIITDPCYLTNGLNEKDKKKIDTFYWAKKHGLCRDTIYGDWSCATLDESSNKIGEFCADSGTVCVVLLKDVLKINPNYDDYIKKPWTATCIKDYKGEVHFEIEEDKWEDNGKEYIDYELTIIGEGNVNFHTIQVGL